MERFLLERDNVLVAVAPLERDCGGSDAMGRRPPSPDANRRFSGYEPTPSDGGHEPAVFGLNDPEQWPDEWPGGEDVLP